MRYRAILIMVMSYMRYSADARIMVLISCTAPEQKFQCNTVFLLRLDVMKFKHYVRTTDLIIAYCFKNDWIYVQSVWKVLIWSHKDVLTEKYDKGNESMQ